MQVPYRKMHAAGNQILLVDQRTNNLPPPASKKLRQLSGDAAGPGFEQMLWLGPADSPSCAASYRIFNADGSEVEQCGNGALCVARYLAAQHGHAQNFTLQSPAGPIAARVHVNGQVTVSMGTPVFAADDTLDCDSILVAGNKLAITTVSLGNPHCVLQVDDVELAPVSEMGREIEHHERFADGTNVGFMQISDRQNILLRVHERGVGETAACGTGACAAVVSGQRLGLLDEAVHVHLPGGQVMVSWRGGDDPVWLTGSAELYSEGTMDL